MKQAGIIFILIAVYGIANSQTVVMERSVTIPDTSDFVSVNTTRSMWGSDLMVGVPYALGDDGAATKFWGTYFIEYGSHYNYRVADFFSLGGSINILFSGYRFKQNDEKLVFDTILHDKEGINLFAFTGAAYLRFTYSRGLPGKYVEFGAREAYHLGRSYTTWDRVSAVDVETTKHKPDFIEPLQTYAYISLGFNGVGIFANYRITDLFKEEYGLPEVNRLTAGVEFLIGQ